MKYIKLDLLTLLISLFIFSSCEKKGSIGLDIAPQDSIKSFFTESATVNATTVREDSVLTSGIFQNPFGFFSDPIFGTTEANLALGFTLPQENITFGSAPTLDSAVLVLKYGHEFYGDSLSSTYTINVHQLSEKFDIAKSYYNNKSWSYNSTPIGTLSNVRSFRWNDSTTINAINKGAPDKPAKVSPQIRIPISADFITSNFLNGDVNNFKNSTAFSAFFKGLLVTINKTQVTGAGGIVFFDLQTPAISGLEIYYKTTTGTVKDTNVTIFRPMSASEIKHNYTGTAIETQLNSPATQSFNTVYAQPLSGVKAKLRFPDLTSLKQNGPISINKAELVLPVVSGTAAFKAAPRLTLYTLDIAGQRKYIPDNAVGLDGRYLDERAFGGFFNSENNTYTFNITSYIQDLINKPVTQYDLYIAPFDLPFTGRTNLSPSATTAARSVLGGKDHPVSPVRLKITYTKPN